MGRAKTLNRQIDSSALDAAWIVQEDQVGMLVGQLRYNGAAVVGAAAIGHDNRGRSALGQNLAEQAGQVGLLVQAGDDNQRLRKRAFLNWDNRPRT